MARIESEGQVPTFVVSVSSIVANAYIAVKDFYKKDCNYAIEKCQNLIKQMISNNSKVDSSLVFQIIVETLIDYALAPEQNVRKVFLH